MDSIALRRAFTDFFVSRDHSPVPGASLIPVDPTLLLTNAGMVPFKPYLLGEETPPYRRATSIQKCARTVDIDIVGTTARHLTFFEMMGNFSFGDYFKELAIPYGYEFVTEALGLDGDRLWFTVYEDDDEAEEIWIETVGVTPERVQRGGRDNFWQMGVAGPAGPSSEIFFDRGEPYGAAGGPVGGGEDRYVEIWNLVFMQYVQDEPYHVIGDLPSKNIDTGAGLERTAMVLQDTPTVFEVDTVMPVLAAGAAATSSRYGDDASRDVSLRILADHGRAIAVLVADGVVPSNEGRGYILRRLLRRAVRHAWRLGGNDLVTPGLVDATVSTLGEAYPELVAKRDFVIEVAEREERRFRQTLASGHNLLETEFEKAEGETLAGDVAFRLHDTYGFPFELTSEIAAERGITVDVAAFEAEMERQRTRARQAWKGGEDARQAEEYRRVLDAVGPTEFLGYELERAPARILFLLRDGEARERAEAGEEVEVFVDHTPFYAEAGGQVGDTGTLETETGELTVLDTTYAVPGLHAHRARVARGFVQVGQDGEAAVDSIRREKIRKSHTGTHLLHWALREVLGEHARQAGSLVEAGRLRFDFSHYAAPDPDQLAEIERLANERVIENAAVTAFHTSKEEADKLGALAFFGDKYGDVVRVVQAGSYSKELCGGTHTPSTGQVGPLVLTGEGSIGSNLRRLEALSGETGYEHLIALRTQLRETAEVLRTQPGDITRAARALMERLVDQEARLGRFEDRYRDEAAAELASTAETVGDVALVAAVRRGSAPDQLRVLALAVRERIGAGVVVLGSERDGKGSLVAAVSPVLVAAGVAAGDIAAAGAGILGGGGSRDPGLAQAGGPRGEAIEEAVAVAADAARGALRSA